MGHWKTYEVTFFNLFSVYKDKNNHRYTWVIGERGRKRERKREREKESERDRVKKEV